MKDSNFTIKIHDFLSMKTLEDTVVFSNKFSTSLPHIPDWVSCEIFIQAWDDKTFMLTIKHLYYFITPLCDVCASQIKKEVTHEDVFYKFFWNCDEELLKDNEISFPSWEWYIDLEPLLIQEIALKEQIKNVCKDCWEKTNDEIDETQEGNWIVRIKQQ